MGKKGQIAWNKGKKGYTTSLKGQKTWEKRPHPRGMLGKLAWNKGKKMWGGKIHPNWKGGISKQEGYDNKQRRIAQEIKAGRKIPEQCEVCGSFGEYGKKEKTLFFDHDHTTGKFRGWICMRCNFALGMVKDNKETLLALVEYLKKNELK